MAPNNKDEASPFAAIYHDNTHRIGAAKLGDCSGMSSSSDSHEGSFSLMEDDNGPANHVVGSRSRCGLHGETTGKLLLVLEENRPFIRVVVRMFEGYWVLRVVC